VTPRRPRALFIGRFQPPHTGHLVALERIAAETQALIVAIGSAQYSHSQENPFTAGERLAMLDAMLQDAGVRATFVPLFDMHRNTIWVSHVRSQVPPFDVVYTNNPLPARLFREAGFEVRGFPLHERERYAATAIRARIAEDDGWESLVPKPVAALIRAFDGPARMRDLRGSDDPIHGKTWVP